MQRRYSILILAPWDARVRRLEVTRLSAAVAVSAALAFLIAGAWFGGNFLWNQWKLASAKKAQAQREELARLKDKADDIQSLLQDWQGLREKVDSSVPADKRLGSKSRLAVAEMQQSLDRLQSELDRLITAIPTEWPAKGKVTSGVGDRVSPWSGKIEFHSGLDIPNPTGTPVYAPGDGTVEAAREMNGNGRTVILNHGQGITTQYLHLSKIYVSVGQQVRKGQAIAEVGSTGLSTSPHLHYEVRVNGVPIDPRQSLLSSDLAVR
jgi:murein DD-endopeptidase MepM/ murein hydrolase activator NlpD